MPKDEISAKLDEIEGLVAKLQPGELVLIRMATLSHPEVQIIGVVNDRSELTAKSQTGTDFYTLGFGYIHVSQTGKENGINLFKSYVVHGRHGELIIPKGKFVISPWLTGAATIEFTAAKSVDDIDSNDPEEGRTIIDVRQGCFGPIGYDERSNPTWNGKVFIITGKEAILQYLEHVLDSFAMIDALGVLNVEPTEKQLQKVKEEAAKQVLTIYAKFSDMQQSKKAFERRLGALRRVAAGSGVLMEEGALSVVENEDDITVMSIGPREELNRQERDFMGNLSRVRGNEPWRFVQSIVLSPGLTLDVKSFLTGFDKRAEPEKMATPAKSRVPG